VLLDFRDAADDYIHVFSEDFSESDADRLGRSRLHGAGRYTGNAGEAGLYRYDDQ
jgi:hypothetical protein